jgi:flagellar hook-associated protein 2
MAAVTLSGFNNIDFNAILEAVMLQERTPITRLETQKSALQQQDTALGQLAGYLSTLQSAAEQLSDSSSFAVLKATSSQQSLVAVSAGSGSTPGSYEVVVNQRAAAQVTASASTATATDVVATSGTLQILATSQPPVSIVVTSGMTLQQLADAINQSESSVTATVVQVTPGNYRLVLTGRQTGLDNAFTLTSTLSGGTGVSFEDSDGDNVYGEAGENKVEAANASLTVNNVAVSSASNTLTDVIPGATLTLNGADADAVVQVTVSRDADAMKEKVKSFVTAYNKLVDFVGTQRDAALKGNPSLARDPMLRNMHQELRSALLGEHGTGSLTRLAAVGIGFDRSGKMTVDETVFNEAIASDPAATQELFAGPDSDAKAGAFDALTALVKGYTAADGLVKETRTRTTDQVKQLTTRIDTLEAQLEIRRAALQKEFIAADQTMQRLQAQVGSLSALGGQYRLF